MPTVDSQTQALLRFQTYLYFNFPRIRSAEVAKISQYVDRYFIGRTRLRLNKKVLKKSTGP